MGMRVKPEIGIKRAEFQHIGGLVDIHMLKRYRQLEVLDRILNAVNTVPDLDTVLNFTIDNIMSVVDCTCGAILVGDKESGVIYHRVYRGISAENMDKIRIPLGEGLTGMVAKTGKSILIKDVSKDPRALPLELGKIECFRGFVCAPIKRLDDNMGAIVVASDHADVFDSDDLSIVKSIGDCLATAIIKTVVEKKIVKGMARYQALLRYALGAQEDERKRVARELHDETSQALTSLTFRLQAAIQMAETKGFGDAKFKESLRKAHSDAVHTGNEVVKLMMDLRPTLLDDLGMPAAIHRYAEDTLEAKGIDVTMEFIGGEYRLPAEVEVACFRVAQGLISNILRHSEAKNVSIKVEYKARQAVLYIEDDGIGFNINKFTEIEPNGRGAGLFTMRERLRLVGGIGIIESKPGQGTKITVTVPIIRDLKDLADEQDKANYS